MTIWLLSFRIFLISASDSEEHSEDELERIEVEAETRTTRGGDEGEEVENMEIEMEEEVETLQEDDFQVEIHISDIEEEIEGERKKLQQEIWNGLNLNLYPAKATFQQITRSRKNLK